MAKFTVTYTTVIRNSTLMTCTLIALRYCRDI